MSASQFKSKSKWIKKLDKKKLVKPPQKVQGTLVTILGCGSSTGTPVLACQCKTCTSKNPKNQRTRASITVQIGQTVFLIDTSPDLRFQALREKLYWIDAVLYTHPHADHLHGIDELRSYNFLLRKEIPCFGNTWTCHSIKKNFDYIFKYTQEGGGKPAIHLNIVKPNTVFNFKKIKIQTIGLQHGKMPVLGYRFKNFAYITDFSFIEKKSLKLLENLDVLILDCLRENPHPTHVNRDEALFYAKKINAKLTYLTHMTHELEYESFKKSLPKNIRPAYDGLKIHIL